MRVLTVRQPWAWAIIHGGKDVENRVRNIAGAYRGPVAIHVAKTEDKFPLHGPIWDAATVAVEAAGGETHERVFTWNLGTPDPRRWLYDHGHIIGVVDLVGAHDSRGDGCGTRKGTARLGELIPLCSEWSEPWAHHLMLANPRPLTRFPDTLVAEPRPFKGALDLRRLDEVTTAAVLGAIA